MRVVPDALYRRHPEFDVREQDLRRQVGQFPSEANAPGNHHGGDALQAFGCPIVEFIGLAAGFQNSEIIASAQAVPCAFGVLGASTGCAVGRNYRSSFASGSSLRARGSILPNPVLFPDFYRQATFSFSFAASVAMPDGPTNALRARTF